MVTMSAYGPATLTEHLQHATYFNALDGLDGTERVQISPEHELSQRVTAILYDKSRLIAEVPHDETGLRADKIAAFFARQGLANKPFMAVDAAGQARINEIMHITPGDIPTIASHFPLFGLNYVRCNPADTLAERHSRELSVAHEGTHANQHHLSILIHEDAEMYHGVGYTIIRNGFINRLKGIKYGSYFEEGLASLEAHKYTVEELGMENGLLDTTKPFGLKTESGEKYFLPGSYLSEGDKPGFVSWSPSAHSAYGLQLLNSLNPAILPTMLDARGSDKALDTFKDHVDAIRPGLHDYLNAQPYEAGRLMGATHAIVRTLFRGNYEEAIAVSAEQDSYGQQELTAA